MPRQFLTAALVALAVSLPASLAAQSAPVTPFSDELKALVCERYPQVPDCAAGAETKRPKRGARHGGIVLVPPRALQGIVAIGFDRSGNFTIDRGGDEISQCGQDARDTCGEGNVAGVNHGSDGSCSFTCFQSTSGD